MIKLELINVTSIVTNGRAIWEREAHVQLIVETLVPPEMAGEYHQQAMQYNKVLEVGPVDPEQNKAAAGVGILAVKGLRPYKLPNPTDDIKDAEATGRCAIYCLDLAGQTLTIAVIYGWTGGTKGSPEAARTDDIIAIVRSQSQLMERGPKLIAADLNGSINAFPTLESMLADHEWVDVGMAEDKCEGKPGQPTCHTNAEARETRIDYLIANAQLMLAISKCWVDNTSCFPTHRPLAIEFCTNKLETVVNQLQVQTIFADLFEAKVQTTYEQQEDKQQ